MGKAARQARRRAQAAEAAPAETLEERLAWCVREREKLARREEAVVRRALAEGATYAELGAALGISRQSAHERFRHLAPAGSRGRKT